MFAFQGCLSPPLLSASHLFPLKTHFLRSCNTVHSSKSSQLLSEPTEKPTGPPMEIKTPNVLPHTAGCPTCGPKRAPQRGATPPAVPSPAAPIPRSSPRPPPPLQEHFLPSRTPPRRKTPASPRFPDTLNSPGAPQSGPWSHNPTSPSAHALTHRGHLRPAYLTLHQTSSTDTGPAVPASGFSSSRLPKRTLGTDAGPPPRVRVGRSPPDRRTRKREKCHFPKAVLDGPVSTQQKKKL